MWHPVLATVHATLSHRSYIRGPSLRCIPGGEDKTTIISGSFGMYVFTVTGGECGHSCWSPVWASVSMHSCWSPVQSSVSMHSCWSPVKGALPVSMLQSISTSDVSNGPVGWPSINTPWSSWSPWQAYRGNIAVGIYHHAVTRVTHNVITTISNQRQHSFFFSRDSFHHRLFHRHLISMEI